LPRRGERPASRRCLRHQRSDPVDEWWRPVQGDRPLQRRRL